MKYVLGFDFNMSTLTAILADTDGNLVGSKNADFRKEHREDGRTWANPDEWADASFALIRELLNEKNVSAEDVVAVGTCGHPVYLAMLGEDGKLCTDSFYWLEGLSLNEVGKELESTVGREKLLSIAAKGPEVLGLGPHPNGPLALGTQLLWLREHEPETYAKLRKVMYGKDYFNYCLTGRTVMDVSDASFTLLFDVKNRCWSKELCDALDIDMSILPDSVECAEVIGTITEAGAARSGLKAGTPVVGGLTNKASIAITSAVIKDGTSVPTVKSCNVVAASSKYVNDPTGCMHTYCSVIPGEYFVMCDGANVGEDMVHFLETYHGDIFQNMRGKRGSPLAKIEAYIQQSPAGANGVVYLPYACGARAPHPNGKACGVFYGIRRDTGDVDLTRAVMEATTYELRLVYEYLEGFGIHCTDIYYHMWGTAPYHKQMFADCMGLPAYQMKAPGGPVMGSAILALAGSGLVKSVPEAVERFYRGVDVSEPDMAAHEAYSRNYETYKKLYKALEQVF